MRLTVASSALAVALGLTNVAAWAQDFSITNSMVVGTPARRDLMRELQAWWDVHAYYPRHASNNDEGGIVKVHLTILPDGRIWKLDVVEGSGSHSLDAAAASAFRQGVVRPFPEGEPEAGIDLSLHYVLAHRHDQPVEAGYAPAASKGPFTIMNDPVKSPILETMLQRTCTGMVTTGGVKNHPIYGKRSWIKAIFFRKPDGTPWIQFYHEGVPSLSPVTEIGKSVQWVGEQEGGGKRDFWWTIYTVWPDGDNHLTGAAGTRTVDAYGLQYSNNIAGPVDLTCETEVLPAVAWSDWRTMKMVTPPGDPP
jgi:TonB family protein